MDKNLMLSILFTVALIAGAGSASHLATISPNANGGASVKGTPQMPEITDAVGETDAWFDILSAWFGDPENESAVNLKLNISSIVVEQISGTTTYYEMHFTPGDFYSNISEKKDNWDLFVRACYQAGGWSYELRESTKNALGVPGSAKVADMTGEVNVSSGIISYNIPTDMLFNARYWQPGDGLSNLWAKTTNAILSITLDRAPDSGYGENYTFFGWTITIGSNKALASAKNGAAATYRITVLSTFSKNREVALAVDNPNPAKWAASVSPATVTVSGYGSSVSTLTVTPSGTVSGDSVTIRITAVHGTNATSLDVVCVSLGNIVAPPDGSDDDGDGIGDNTPDNGTGDGGADDDAGDTSGEDDAGSGDTDDGKKKIPGFGVITLSCAIFIVAAIGRRRG